MFFLVLQHTDIAFCSKNYIVLKLKCAIYRNFSLPYHIFFLT